MLEAMTLTVLLIIVITSDDDRGGPHAGIKRVPIEPPPSPAPRIMR